MLITRRMERPGMAPLGYVATDYVLGIWAANRPTGIAALFDQDMLGDDLETWLADSSMLKRTFRNVAVIAGLIQRHHPGAEKTRKQVTVNSDLIYEVLRRHQPDHILLRATRADAAGGLIDVGRIAGMLARVKGHITHMVLSRVSPLAVPVLLEIGRESVRTGEDEDALLAEAEAIIAEATGEAEPPAPATTHVPAIHRPNAARRSGGQSPTGAKRTWLPKRPAPRPASSRAKPTGQPDLFH
jgi:ATP-dependent Lhr-like helicase